MIFWLALFLPSFITVANCFIGLALTGAGEKCILKIYQRHYLDEGEWVDRGNHSDIACYDSVIKSNKAHFTVATDDSGEIYLTYMAISKEGALKLAYLDPVSKTFIKRKTWRPKERCFDDDKVELRTNLNFKSGAVFISVVGREDCKLEIPPEIFFNKDQTELDETPGSRKKRDVDLDSGFALHPLFSHPSHTSRFIYDEDEATGKPYKFFGSGIIIDGRPIDYIEVTSNITLVEDPMFFVNGNYSIIRNSNRYDTRSQSSQISYVVIDMFSDSAPFPDYQWPAFSYVFDETAFEQTFYFAEPPPGRVLEDNSSLFIPNIFIGFLLIFINAIIQVVL